MAIQDFPVGTIVKNPIANARDMGLIPDPERFHMHRATKPVGHNCWAHALEPERGNYWAQVLQLPKPMHLEPVLCNKRSHSNEKPPHATRESLSAATKIQHHQKNKIKIRWPSSGMLVDVYEK